MSSGTLSSAKKKIPSKAAVSTIMVPEIDALHVDSCLRCEAVYASAEVSKRPPMDARASCQQTVPCLIHEKRAGADLSPHQGGGAWLLVALVHEAQPGATPFTPLRLEPAQRFGVPSLVAVLC